MDFTEGQIVRSKAGREKGKFMIVLSAEKEYLFLTDGKERPRERPKRKKKMHVQETHTVVPQECIRTNREIRKAIREFTGKADDTVGGF